MEENVVYGKIFGTQIAGEMPKIENKLRKNC